MDAVASTLKDLFADKGILDTREALWTGEVAGSSWAVYAPSATTWTQLAISVALQTLIQVSCAVLIYYFIVQRRGSIEAYLFGYGVIIPFAIWVPFQLMEFFDVRNSVLQLSFSTVFTVVCYHCMEAMYGTSEYGLYIEANLKNFVMYYASAMPLKWDPKTKTVAKVSGQQLFLYFVEILVYFAAASVLLSFLIHFDFRPFPSNVALNKMDITWDLLAPGHIVNSYFCALMVYMTLKVGFDLTAFGENAKGMATNSKLFDGPFLHSRSPTEFWTERWNVVIQPILKGGIYGPLRKIGFPAKPAVWLTFAVSGLYHDYVWWVTFYKPSTMFDSDGSCKADEHCYVPHFGRVTAFFAYCGLIMLLERPFAKLPTAQSLKRLPSPVIAHLIVLVHLPLAHWYVGDWIEGPYFDHFSISLWSIKKMA